MFAAFPRDQRKFTYRLELAVRLNIIPLPNVDGFLEFDEYSRQFFRPKSEWNEIDARRSV